MSKNILQKVKIAVDNVNSMVYYGLVPKGNKLYTGSKHCKRREKKMKIKLYQIDAEMDPCFLMYESYNSMKKITHSDSDVVDSTIYDCVFDGEVDCKDLEDVYYMFNMNHPEGYKGRSMSVSDVVEVIREDKSLFHYCDSIGFKTIEFRKEGAA